MTHVHLVGSIGLDTVDDVFSAVGDLLGPYIPRCPDGEPGGRRLWVTWQYPLLRANVALKPDESRLLPGVGVCSLRLKDGAKPEDVHFGELGYAREARASYQDFLAARDRGILPRGTRFQVSIPTPFAIIAAFIVPDQINLVLPAYERAMLREVERLCAAIPHKDLAIQWDVCLEMIMWDGRLPRMSSFPGMERVYAETFARLGQAVPPDVELGFHLCYGDLEGQHFIEPEDTRKAVELANLLIANVKHPIAWIHLPVPINRDDEAYFAPLRELKRGPGTELFLGLAHAKDGVAGTTRRMAAAKKVVGDFGIATECGMGRAKTPEHVRELLRIQGEAAKS